MIACILIITAVLCLRAFINDMNPSGPSQGTVDTALLAANNTWTGTNTFQNTTTISASSDTTKSLTFNTANQTTGTLVTLNTGAQTANRTLSLPVLTANDTLAALGVAQTFSATCTFSTPPSFTQATGTAPFTVTSTTVVANLNCSTLLGNTWASPGAIGGTSPGSAAHTTISATGQITSTLAGGTAPFVVASSTVVANLNVSQLLGQTWANPGAIGGTTPATTFALSGILTSTNTTSATTSLLGAVVIGNGTAATSIGMGAGIISAGTGLGIGAAPTATTPINVSVSQNAGTEMQVANPNAGGAASANYWATNGTSTVQFGKLGTAYTTSGVLVANTGIVYDGGAAGLAIVAASGTIVFAAGGTTQCAAFSSAGLFTSSIAGGNTFTVTSTANSAYIVASDTGTGQTAGFIAQGDATGFATYKYKLGATNELQHYFSGTSWTFNDIANGWNPLVYAAGATSAGTFTFAGTLGASSSTTGAVVIGNGTAATSVAIGGGNVRLGGVLVSGGAATLGGTSVPSANTFAGNIIWGRNTGAADTAGAAGEVIAGTGTTSYTSYTTTATYQQVDTIALTAGKWQIIAHGTFSSNGATLTASTSEIFAISTTTASATGTTEGSGDILYIPGSLATGVSDKCSVTLSKIVNISATTNYFFNAQATWTAAGPPQFVGKMYATRLL